MQSLKDMGAIEVHVCTTHGILSQNASAAFNELGFPVGVTNTINRAPEYLAENPWLKLHPIDALLAEAIREASTIEGSISEISSR
jgi:phosphoribosylpyrophosphate synthetase